MRQPHRSSPRIVADTQVQGRKSGDTGKEQWRLNDSRTSRDPVPESLARVSSCAAYTGTRTRSALVLDRQVGTPTKHRIPAGAAPVSGLQYRRGTRRRERHWPTTRISERILRGRGWVVGALLLPAAVPSLVPEPATLRDSNRSLSAPQLHADVTRCMSTPELSPDAARTRSTEAFSGWISERVPPSVPGSEQALANELASILSDPDVTRADQLPELLHVSARSLQRLATRFFGLSLHSMIRRRRLQEAAERLRVDPVCSIAGLANELGYSDHSHFSTDFKAVLGMTPRRYRQSLSG